MSDQKLVKKPYTIYSFSVNIRGKGKIKTFAQKTDEEAWEDLGVQYESDAEMYQFTSILVRDKEGKVLGSVQYDEDGFGNVTAESPWSMEVARDLALNYCRRYAKKFLKASRKIENET